MSERRTLKIELFDGGSCFETDDNHWTLPDAIEFFQDLLAEIPEEHRASSHFLVKHESGYYDSGASTVFSVWYERPETDEELAARLAEERARSDADVREREARERATLAALQRKYGSAR